MSNVKQGKAARSSEKKASKTGRKPYDVEELMCKVMYEAPKALKDEDLAKFLGISVAMFYALKAKNMEFLEVIKHYKRVSPIEVLNSFKKIACGFTFDEKTLELKKDSKTGKSKLVVTKVVKKYIAPNAQAGIFYLKNQMQEEFKEKIEVDNKFPNQLDQITFVINGRQLASGNHEHS